MKALTEHLVTAHRMPRKRHILVSVDNTLEGKRYRRRQAGNQSGKMPEACK